ncbi:iron-containing alcohol dehydrogenase [Bifidobacterium longum]|nr:iron-containing alcohol dehydrogenase [Bifidobacterium longum]MDB6602233.1 iron-containing alcohol dehydrogenase [Bifidobacterium longum]MDB6604411.1 iron-containing alcohol dehydrogenase [Bifidobacterium longum]MDB6606285.1 iron-containing alcohol dehydrogenase [Bifidobacterium longum]MDB6608101.1 iron-containing alcohol dehydrogenase [Bifidobacterium longum]
MRDFTICIGTTFVFGRDAETKVGDELGAKGVSRVLIHHDGGAYLETSGLLDAVRRSLGRAGISYTELGGVKPNPRLTLVREGIAIAKARNVDAVVAIGGGSVIDSAKAIALGAAGERDVWDYFTGKVPVERTLPVAVVLTCPASGSESSQVAVINNEHEHSKLTLSEPVLRPTFAFMNPELSVTVPAFPTACGIVDMFSHICERYFSADNEIGVIDRMAEGALRTLVDVGPKSLADLADYDLRAQIMWISTIAQNNTLGVGREQDWSTHLIANELSALYDTPHGATLSIIMGSWMRVASEKAPFRFARYATEVFGIRPGSMNETELARRGIAATESFFRSLGMPVSFKDFDLPGDGIERMLDNIDFYGPDATIGSIARLDRDDCRRIYELAVTGPVMGKES